MPFGKAGIAQRGHPVRLLVGAVAILSSLYCSSDDLGSSSPDTATGADSLVDTDIVADTDDSDTTGDCIPRDKAPAMPATASEYAQLCEEYLGVVPTVDCGDGVPIPVYVDGVEVFETQSATQCDDTDFKGQCATGSRIGRVQGVDVDGTALPDVTWVYFCRSPGEQWFQFGIASVQLIGHNTETGATCFFESPDALGDDAQWAYLELDEDGLLDGQLPGPDEPEFDEVFITPDGCVQCHQTDPFIHNPWIDGARLPSDPSQPVLPNVLGLNSPYWVVGGASWDMRTVHIEGNACLSCHPAPMATAELFEENGHIRVNELMPPTDPGSTPEAYAELMACHRNGPETVEGCEWVTPPGDPYCEEEPDSPDDQDTGDDEEPSDDEECPKDFDPTAPCTNGDKCTSNGQWYLCFNGSWVVV